MIPAVSATATRAGRPRQYWLRHCAGRPGRGPHSLALTGSSPASPPCDVLVGRNGRSAASELCRNDVHRLARGSGTGGCEQSQRDGGACAPPSHCLVLDGDRSLRHVALPSSIVSGQVWTALSCR